MVTQGCLVGFWVFEGIFVHPKSGLKGGGGQANVCMYVFQAQTRFS